MVVPTLLFPANGATGVSVTTLFQYNIASKIYSIRFRLNGEIIQTVYAFGGLIGTKWFNPTDDLSYDTVYAWTIEVSDSPANPPPAESWGIPDSFSLTTESLILPPGKVTNPTPADETTKVGKGDVFNSDVTLEWDAPEEKGSGEEYLQYKVYLRQYGEEWGGSIATVNHSESNGWDISVEPYTYYQWRVDCYDSDADVTTTGGTWWFVTAQESIYVTTIGNPTRRDDYDDDLIWDESSEAWYDPGDIELVVAGGGRYKQQVVVVGTDNNGVGRIYFGSD